MRERSRQRNRRPWQRWLVWGSRVDKRRGVAASSKPDRCLGVYFLRLEPGVVGLLGRGAYAQWLKSSLGRFSGDYEGKEIDLNSKAQRLLELARENL